MVFVRCFSLGVPPAEGGGGLELPDQRRLTAGVAAFVALLVMYGAGVPVSGPGGSCAISSGFPVFLKSLFLGSLTYC